MLYRVHLTIRTHNFSGVNPTTIRSGPQQSPEKLLSKFLRNVRREIMADTVDEDNVEEHQKVDEFKVIIFFLKSINNNVDISITFTRCTLIFSLF